MELVVLFPVLVIIVIFVFVVIDGLLLALFGRGFALLGSGLLGLLGGGFIFLVLIIFVLILVIFIRLRLGLILGLLGRCLS